MDSSRPKLLHQKTRKPNIKVIPGDITPDNIAWGDGGKPAIIRFSNNKYAQGSCIRCINPPCIVYGIEEITSTVFPDFPQENSMDVCPTQAITWQLDGDSPSVNPNLCILCGLCISRCPVRAIYADQDLHSAVINDNANDCFVFSESSNELRSTERTKQLFEDIKETGIYVAESDEIVLSFHRKIDEIASGLSSQFPNLISRNLLIGAGINTAMRRQGNAYIRMDLMLGPPGVEQGVAEVEFHQDYVGAVRKVLDDIAVLVSRYGFHKDTLSPYIIMHSLPNNRSEYWQLIKDTLNVLDIRIQSLSLVSLLLINWNRKKIDLDDDFYLDIVSKSLRLKIETILDKKLNFTQVDHQGNLECGK